MAAITFDYTGTELTQTRAENPSPLAPIESGARVRVKQFSYTATGVVADGAQIELAEFPARVAIIGGALTTATIAGSGALNIGWTPTASPVDTNVAAFGSIETGPIAFDPAMVVTTEKTTVFATVKPSSPSGVNGGVLAADDTFSGYILYVENS
jgi:hypothetical protein